MPSLRELEQAFWAQVRRCRHGRTCKRCCWEWQNKGKPRMGYGQLSYPGLKKPLTAHRFALELAHGALIFPVPQGCYTWRHTLQPLRCFVLHLCDNPPCVNPSHLTIGTPADNMLDCRLKGRTRGGRNGSWTRQEVPHAGNAL